MSVSLAIKNAKHVADHSLIAQLAEMITRWMVINVCVQKGYLMRDSSVLIVMKVVKLVMVIKATIV